MKKLSGKLFANVEKNKQAEKELTTAASNLDKHNKEKFSDKVPSTLKLDLSFFSIFDLFFYFPFAHHQEKKIEQKKAIRKQILLGPQRQSKPIEVARFAWSYAVKLASQFIGAVCSDLLLLRRGEGGAK